MNSAASRPAYCASQRRRRRPIFFSASAIPRFLAQYPEISLDLSFNEALTDIVAERFDAGIRIGERIERDMIAVRVTDELPLVVAGSPAYFAQRGKPKSPKDLVAHDCLRTRFASGTYLPWRFRVKRRDLEVHVEGRLVVNSASLARRVAVEGLALIQTPLLFIASDLSEGKLTTVLEQWAPTPVTGFFLYYPSRRQMRPALKALVDFLRDEPWRVQATLAMNRQETAVGNRSRWLDGLGGPSVRHTKAAHAMHAKLAVDDSAGVVPHSRRAYRMPEVERACAHEIDGLWTGDELGFANPVESFLAHELARSFRGSQRGTAATNSSTRTRMTDCAEITAEGVHHGKLSYRQRAGGPPLLGAQGVA